MVRIWPNACGLITLQARPEASDSRKNGDLKKNGGA
jgi:hypothetical protein